VSSQKRARWAPGATALADAARALCAVVFEGRSADTALAPFAASKERAAVRAITLGCVRWHLRLAPAIECLLSRPEGVAPAIRALLVAAAHQIEYSRNPPESTANAAVDAARILGQQRATGLVNAVLRRFVAGRSELLGRVDEELAGRTAHPQWLVQEVGAQWPGREESILHQGNEHPPMTLRVDLGRVRAEAYVRELADAGIAARCIDWMPSAVVLERPVGVSALPGFKEGRVSVQDAGAQLAAELLDAQPGMRVLDACAAPGGKTGHLLERTAELSALVAVDIDAERVGRIRDNLKRLGRKALTVQADVRHPDGFWDGRPFERILVDAPCSSTGVIRRHPDIKLLRRPTDLTAFAETQRAIVSACFSMLAPGGRLLYATCSLLRQENEAVMEAFLSVQDGARAVTLPLRAPGALARSVGFQLLPGETAGSDGFYYACVEKTTTGN
jgi:16S rRNA (cytosine967-C5)-methyltransferase